MDAFHVTVCDAGILTAMLMSVIITLFQLNKPSVQWWQMHLLKFDGTFTLMIVMLPSTFFLSIIAVDFLHGICVCVCVCLCMCVLVSVCVFVCVCVM